MLGISGTEYKVIESLGAINNSDIKYFQVGDSMMHQVNINMKILASGHNKSVLLKQIKACKTQFNTTRNYIIVREYALCKICNNKLKPIYISK